MQDYIPRGIDINGTIDTVEVRQYDNNSRFIRVKLRDDDLAEDNNTFDLSDCTTALYIRAESGGDVSFINGTVESPSGVVTFLIPGSVTQVAGNYLCQIRIYEGDDTDRPVISSKPFRLTVDESIAEDAAIEATPDYSALTATMTNYQALKNQMAALVASPAGSGGDVGTEVRDARVGKGQTYSTAGDAVRAAVQGVSAFLGAANFAASPILADFNNLPNNIIRGCGVYVIPQSSSEADDIPAGKIKIANAPVTGQMTGLIVTLGRRTDRIAGDTQIFIPWHGGTIKYRQYSSVSVEQSQTYAWSDWVTGNEDVKAELEAEIALLPQYRSNINNTAASYNNLLSNYTKEGTFFALAANWNDIPARDNNTDSSHFANNDSYVVTNKQYSNYILQTAVGIASGAIYNRVIHKTNKTVFRDWYCVNLDAKPMNILAVGDSICWGGRNSHKGFVGDIGLPYQNIGVVGATLSNKVTSVTNIPNKLVEFYNSHSQAVNANNDGWAPDVIIANGGVNDYFYSAPLGNVPTAPAITDAEANAFDRSTVMGGLQYLLYKMISCYPSAQRFFLISHKTYGAKSSADSTPVYWVSTACAAGYTQQDLHDAIVACCNVYGVRVIDVYSESMIDSVFSQYRSVTPYSSDHSITDTEYVDSDGIHPLAKGYLEGYKPLILAALKGSTSGSYCSYQTLQNVRTDLEEQISKAASAGAAVRNQIESLSPYNPFDLLPLNSIATNGTHNGVTYTFSGNQCTVTGTSTGVSFKNICDSGSRLPDGMTAGKPIYCKYCTDDNNVRLALAFRDENNAQIGSMQYLITDRVVTVPQNAVRFIARIDVPLGKTVNSTVEFAALTELTHSDMESQIEQLTTDVTAMQTNDNEMKATLNDLATENLLLPAYESDNETTVHHGITYQKVNGRYHIFGTATGISFHDIYANTEQLPSWLEKNRQYYVNYQAEKVRFIILPVGGSSDTSLINHIAGGIFVIPADVTGVYIRLWVADGETVNESVFPYVSSYEPSATQLVEINKVAGPRYVYADTSKTATGKLIHAHNVKPMTAINVSGFNATSNLIVCGKNLYRNPHGLTTYQGNGVTITFSETAGTIDVDSDGATGNVTGPATFSTLNDANWRCQFKFSLPRDTVVTFSENSNADGFEYSRCYCEISNGVDSIKLTGHPATLNMKANVEYGLRIHVSTGFSGSVTFKPQIEINEFPTEFEPFSGIIYNNGDSIVLNERTTSPACIMTATNFANMISYNEPATVTYRAAYAVDRVYQDYVNRVKQVGEKPMLLSFVDDDTSSLANVQLFHDALAEIGVVGSFAAITNNLQNDSALVSTLLQYEAEGFGICCHASNQDGANTDYFRPYEDRDIERVRDNMMTAKRYMQQAGFISGNIWVTPYGVNDEQIRDLARSLGFDGLISTLNYTPVIHGITDRYNIPRYSIERSTDMIKVGMDACTKYGGWVIVTSHAYNWGDNADTYKSKIAELVDYADEIGMKTVNVQEGFETFFGDSQISPSLITEWKSSLINNINSRITANSELIDEIVAQSAYLLPTGDTTDRTAEIVTMLTQTGVCHLGAGVFYVSGIDMPDDATLTGSGSKTVVRLNGSGSYAVKMSHRNTVSDLTIEGSDSNITLNENVGTRHGILWQGDYTQTQSQSDATTRQPTYGILSNLRIRRFTGGGITCSDTGYGTINFIEGTNIIVNNCNAGINISYWSEFHKFTNVRTYGCYYGCINNGGNNTFVNCDFSTCKLGFLMDNTNGQSPNNSHGSAVGCVFNHTDSNNGVGIKIINCNNGYIFTGCHIWFSQVDIRDSSGIVFSSCEFGSTNAVITVNGGGAVLFANNMHGAQPTKAITNNNAVRFVNCYVRSDGTAVE